MDVPVLVFLASSGRMPRHVVQHWKRQVWKPRDALLILIVLGAYFTASTDDESSQGPADPASPSSGSHDAHESVPVAVALSVFVASGVAGAAVPILQLLRLWGSRLIAAALVHSLESMPLEARTRSWRLRALVWSVAIWINCMAMTTTLDFTARILVSMLEPACRWAGLLLPAGPFAPLSPERSILPLKSLVQLEAVATMASAWSIVMRVEPLLSSRMMVSSPSHAPSLERSAFFTSIKSFFTGPANARAARRHQARQRRLARRRRQARAMGQHAAAPTEVDTSAADASGPQHDARARPGPQHRTVPSGPPEMPVPAVKPPREAGHAVQLDLIWVSDVLLALINRAMAAAQYTVVLASLPRVTFATVVAGLALHQQVSVVVDTWSDARGAAECLEFVLRRWPGPSANKEAEEQVCPMCFEPVVPHYDPTDTAELHLEPSEDELSYAHSASKGTACLDCGHLLHPTCLVAWLVNQAFCPTCHMPLQLAPPPAPAHNSRSHRLTPASLPTHSDGQLAE